MARSRRKKISTLGTIAILAGGLAWFGLQTGRLDKGAVLIGAVGTLLGLLAMLGSRLIGNTGRILPLLGLLASASITVYGMSHETTRVAVAEQLKQWVVRFTPAPPPAQKPAPVAPPLASAPPAEDVKPFGSGTIFDMTPGGKSGSSPNTAGAVPAPMVRPAPQEQGEPRVQAPSALNVNPLLPIPAPGCSTQRSGTVRHRRW